MATRSQLNVSEAEYQQRMETLLEAEATLAIEGIPLPEEARKLGERNATGEIDFRAYRSLVAAAARKLANEPVRSG